MELALWLISLVLVLWGIVTWIRGAAFQGIFLFVLGLLIGPFGLSLFS